MIGIEVFIVTFMSIFCFMCDMQINYKMGKYGVYKYNVCKIVQIYMPSSISIKILPEKIKVL